MKIFKHRGDIYISKSSGKKSREEHILLIMLAIIVIFTVVFFAILSQKYSSVKEFFAGDSVTVTQQVNNGVEELPQISGKSNFLIIETDEEESVIHFAFLVQADKDTQSYKVCTLSPDTDIDGQSLYDLYSLGGGATIQTKLTAYLGINIDYYAALKTDDFIEFVNKLGTYIYPSDEAIKFNNDNPDDKYSVRIGTGEQKLSGSETSDLLRYYSNENVNYAKANQIILYGLTELFNAENFDNAEAIFRLFINSATTNITVRNFQDNIDAIEVFCKKNSDIAVYSATVKYKSNVLTPKSVQEIKGYFSE